MAKRPVVSASSNFMAIKSVAPLDRFEIAPENPRSVRDPAHVKELAAGMAAEGQLQPVICYAKDGSPGAPLMITVGGTRLCAAKQAGLPELWFELKDMAAAIRAGLAEEEGHTPLHPADQAVAYAAALRRETGDATGEIADTLAAARLTALANRLGKTPRFVEQRLRLAKLHKPILEALRKDRISLPQAQAWANASDARQAELWKVASNRDADPRSIKDRIDKADLAETDRLVKFVGESAYKAAGGGVRLDLFDVSEDARHKAGAHFDATKVKELARERLAEAKEKIAAEGWGHIETTLSLRWGAPTKTCKTKAEKAKRGAIISIDDTGKLKVLRGVALKAEAGAPAGGKAAPERDWKSEEAERTRRHRLFGVTAQLVGRAIGDKPGLALACFAAALARDAFNLKKTPEVVTITVCQDEDVYGLANDKAFAAMRKEWIQRLTPHASKLEAHLLTLSSSDIDQLLACILAGAIDFSDWSARVNTGAGAKLSELFTLSGSHLPSFVTPKIQDVVENELVRQLLGLGPLEKPKPARAKAKAAA